MTTKIYKPIDINSSELILMWKKKKQKQKKTFFSKIAFNRVYMVESMTLSFFLIGVF